MFIVPYSTDVHDGRIRLAALQIIGICILTHFLVSWDTQKINQEMTSVVQQWEEEQRIKVFQSSDSAQVDPFKQLEELIEQYPKITATAPPPDLIVRVKEVQKKSLMYRFGLVLSDIKLHAIFTSMFTHAGWFHLIGNMILFYVCGLAMEQYWGYWRFMLIYIGCGIAAEVSFAALSFATHTHMNGIPLVGASGAIAGIMGAFMVTHFHVNVKLFYMLGLWYRGVFKLPAYIYFGFWFMQQIAALFMDKTLSSGVAYSAHIGGFIVGGILGKMVMSEDSASIVDHKLARIHLEKNSETEQNLFPKGFYHMPIRETLSPDQYEDKPTETPLVAVTEKAGWEALQRNDVLSARQQLSEAAHTVLQNPEQYRPILTHLFTQLLKHYNRIQFSQNEYYQWAKRLDACKEYKFAIACFDLAVYQDGSLHVQKNSILEASRLRIKTSVQLDKAQHDLEYLTSIDPEGIAGNHAKSMCMQLAGYGSVRGN